MEHDPDTPSQDVGACVGLPPLRRDDAFRAMFRVPYSADVLAARVSTVLKLDDHAPVLDRRVCLVDTTNAPVLTTTDGMLCNDIALLQLALSVDDFVYYPRIVRDHVGGCDVVWGYMSCDDMGFAVKSQLPSTRLNHAALCRTARALIHEMGGVHAVFWHCDVFFHALLRLVCVSAPAEPLPLPDDVGELRRLLFAASTFVRKDPLALLATRNEVMSSRAILSTLPTPSAVPASSPTCSLS